MKLHVTLVDAWTAYNEAMMSIPTRAQPRLVTIELTGEQAAQLAPRKVGSNGGTDIFESYGMIWLEGT